jgi:hypothetical protein
MEDQDVGRLLRELPRERAREGFTARVLASLDTPVTRRTWWQPRLVLAAAALAAVLASAGVLQVRSERQEEMRKAEARRILQELRSEHESLKQELQSLSEPPVVYVGGNEDVDLVVDLSRVQNVSF